MLAFRSSASARGPVYNDFRAKGVPSGPEAPDASCPPVTRTQKRVQFVLRSHQCETAGSESRLKAPQTTSSLSSLRGHGKHGG
ncbi:hypothetical protein FQN60_009804, partial [Etheostoma spectabile]